MYPIPIEACFGTLRKLDQDPLFELWILLTSSFVAVMMYTERYVYEAKVVKKTANFYLK